MKIFVTDYASYNNGTQFVFGHWLDMSDFSDGEELSDHIADHFEECDKKSPLYSGKREELMITDYKGFPKSLYSESGMNFDHVYEWNELDETQKIAYEILTDNHGYSHDQAIAAADDVMIGENSSGAKYDEFDSWYPEFESNNPYVTVDYDQFFRENFTVWGDHYYADHSIG